MKRSIIVAIGIILILLVLGTWAYLLFFGTPKTSDDVFANLGFGGTPAQNTPAPTPSEPTPVVETARIDTKNALTQLTTRPVAGFGFAGTSSTVIRYVERGTGHVYEIETVTGTEKRVSGTTIPQVVEAVFSESGNSVALISENATERKVFTGIIPNADDSVNIDFLTLPPNSFAPNFINDTTLQYARTTDIGTEGYTIDVRNESSNRIFSIPVKDISIIWGEETFIYNKPAAVMPGALYKVTSQLNPVTPQSFNFIGGVNPDYYFGSENTDGEVVSYATNRLTGEQLPLSVNYTPEKCAFVTENTAKIWCASDFNQNSTNFTEDWYKGITLSEDMLWSLDISNGSAELAVDFQNRTGRTIDVDKITAAHNGNVLIFRNKIDGALWLYDSTLE